MQLYTIYYNTPLHNKRRVHDGISRQFYFVANISMDIRVFLKIYTLYIYIANLTSTVLVQLR